MSTSMVQLLFKAIVPRQHIGNRKLSFDFCGSCIRSIDTKGQILDHSKDSFQSKLSGRGTILIFFHIISRTYRLYL